MILWKVGSLVLQQLILKEQSHPSVSNVTSADVSITTSLNSSMSLVNVTNSV